MWPDPLKHCMFCVEQKLSGSHKALVEMQDDVSELMRSASKEHPTSKVTLLKFALPVSSLSSVQNPGSAPAKPSLALITALLFAGVSYSDPGGFEFNRDQLAAADSFSGLSEPAFGEFLVAGLELRKNKGGVEPVLVWSSKSLVEVYNSFLLTDSSRKGNENLDQVNFEFKDQHRKVDNMPSYIYKLQP